MKQAQHFYISGRVQGVGFRWATCNRASDLHLTGWVRNLRDGRVEVWAEGDALSLAHLAEWLKHGPTSARVDGLSENLVEVKNYKDFKEIT